MFRKVIIALIVLLFPVSSFAQTAKEKKALKHIRQQQYNSAIVLLKKALANDSANVAAEYVLSMYFSAPENEEYHLDSAYFHARRAMRLWAVQTERQRSKLKRFDLDSTVIVEHKTAIEERAFVAARSLNTELAYNHFLQFYVEADQAQVVSELRDKVAFDEAVQINTHQAFESYLQRYPDSKWAAEAKVRHELLVFQDETAGKDSAAYAAFLGKHPESPHRTEAERHIFEISTANGNNISFERFIRQYPSSRFARRAADMLFHLLSEEQRIAFADLLNLDSLGHLEDRFLVPFLSRDKFGLMDATGSEVLPATIEDIPDDYLCGGINEDLILLTDRVINKGGVTLAEGYVDSIDDIGAGFVLLHRPEGNSMLHKSGFLLPEENVEDAKLIGRFLALQRDGRWGLFTLHGRNIIPYRCDDIDAIGNVILLKIGQKYSLATTESLAAIVNNKRGRFTDGFDDVREGTADNVIVRSDKFQGILDQHLGILVKMDTHRLSPAFFGALAESTSGFSTFNQFGEQSEYFEKIQVVNPWVAAKNAAGWMLYDPSLRIMMSVPYDTVSIFGPFAVGHTKNSIEVHLYQNSHKSFILPVPERVELVPSPDSIGYLAVLMDRKWTVFNGKGAPLFTAGFDRIQSVGSGLFVVTQKERKGIVNSKGKQLLPSEYDAIGNATGGLLSLLKAGKFGVFHYEAGKVIKPEYEKNIAAYNGDFLTVYKNGMWGFIDLTNKPVTAIEYEQILHWTDSVALVKAPAGWSLLNLYTRKVELGNIKSFRPIRETKGEKLYIFQSASDMGVLSSSAGVVIPFRFTDIINVGSADTPVYFTEKHVPEASLFVVIYYDSQGKLIRKDVYEQDDYERIYCQPSVRM